MHSISEDDNDCRSLEEELTKARQVIENLREDNRRLEARLNAMELERMQTDRLMANKALSPAQRLIFWAACNWHRMFRADYEERANVNVEELARLAGVSDDTAGKNLKKLTEAGALDYQWVRDKHRDDISRKMVYRVKSTLAVNPSAVTSPEFIALADGPRRHGGLRCKNCGSNRVEKWVSVHCLECGHNEIHQIGKSSDPDDDCSDQGATSDPVSSPISTPVAVPTTPAPEPEPEPTDDEDTEKRPAVRPAAPVAPCKFCNVVRWIWYAGDEKEAAGYICRNCYTQASIAVLTREEVSSWRTPF